MVILSAASSFPLCICHHCSQLIVLLQQCRVMGCVMGELKAAGSTSVIPALAGGTADRTSILCVLLSHRTGEQNSSCHCREGFSDLQTAVRELESEAARAEHLHAQQDVKIGCSWCPRFPVILEAHGEECFPAEEERQSPDVTCLSSYTAEQEAVNSVLTPEHLCSLSTCQGLYWKLTPLLSLQHLPSSS